MYRGYSSSLPRTRNHTAIMHPLVVRGLAILSLIVLTANFVAAQNPAPTPLVSAKAVDNYLHLPLAFERRGVGADETWVARGQGYAIGVNRGKTTIRTVPAKTGQAGATVSLEFAGAKSPAAVPGTELPGKVNYIRGNDPKKWQVGLSTYDRVTYRGLYPGVDLVYYGNQQELEFDLVVKPGADPHAIRMKVGGTEKLSIDGSGDLMIGENDLRIALPRIYQEINGAKKTIAGHYALRGRDEVAFEVAGWDRTQPLVIDPGITVSALLGGATGSTFGRSIALDSSGNICIAGYTFASDFPTSNAAQSGTSGTPDGFITAINNTGTSLIYSTYIGGSSTDEFFGIAVDSGGNAWVTGYSQSNDFPTLHATQSIKGGNADAVVVELNSSGALAFSTYLGGSGQDEGLGIAVDTATPPNAYVTGFTNGSFPTTTGATNQGSSDIFVTKYSSAGTVVYSTMFGGVNPDQGNAIAVDSAGNAYITGFTLSSSFIPANPAGGAQPAIVGGYDAFVAELNPTASGLVYFTYLGGSGITQGNAIAVNPATGVAYVAGYTTSSGLATPGAAQASYAAGYDGFVAEVNAGGTAFNYVTYLGGNRNDFIEGLALDGSGHVYVTGYTDSNLNFPTASPLQGALSGNTTSLFQTTNSGTSWSVFDGNIPGAVFDVSPDPVTSGTIVAASDQGVYYTTTGGASWTQEINELSSGVGIYLARSPVTPSTIYYTVGGTTQISTNNGVNWTTKGNLTSVANGIVADGVSASTAYVFSNGSGVSVTTNSGTSWTTVNSGLPSMNVVAMAAGTNGGVGTVYAVLQNNGVYMSTNQGGSWTPMNSGLPGFISAGPHSIAVLSGTPASLAFAASGQVYFYAGFWSPSGFPNYAEVVSNFTVDAMSNRYLYAGSNDGSVYSINSITQSWAHDAHLTTSSITSLVADPLNIGYVYGVSAVPTAAFVARLNSLGSVFSYSTYLGGIGAAEGLGIAAPAAGGQAYVTGYTAGASAAASAGFPITSAFLPSNQTDAFVTVIADIAASCTYSVNPTSSTVTGSGQLLVLSVVAPNNCSWTILGNPNWVTVFSAPSSGTGDVQVIVQTNATGSTRSTTFTIAGQSVSITQADSSCNFGLDQSTYVVSAAGGSVTANLTTGAGCAWAVTDNAPASITINSGASGTGNGTISLSVATNNDLNSRNFSLPVGNNVINITQYGTCVYTLSSSSANNVSAAGVSNTLLTFTTSAPACSTFPPVFSNQSWITYFTSNDSVTYSVAANAGSARSGQLTIGGATFTINQLAPGLTITSGPGYGTFSVGDVQAPLSASGGVPPYTWTVTSGLLPTGTYIRYDLPSFFPSIASAGIIGVTTATASPASFTLQVQDSLGATASQPATLLVTGLTVTDPYQLPDAFTGVAYSWALNAAGNTGAVTWGVANGSSLPPGFSLLGGAITSNPLPTTTGFYSFTITATDSTGTVYRSYSINVYGPGFVGSGALGNVTVGSLITPIQLTGQGGTPPYTFTGGTSPGLSLSSSGAITGTPSCCAGTYFFYVTITDHAGLSYNKQFIINYLNSNGTANLLQLTPPTVSDASLGQYQSYQFAVYQGKQPYTWSAQSLPAGMQLVTSAQNPSLGVDAQIAGAPLATGTYPITVSVMDSSSPPVTVNLPFTIVVTAMDSDYPSQFTRGSGSTSFYLRPIGGSTPFTWSMTGGSLPSGLTFNSATGIVSGTPVENGNFNATFRITSGALQLNRSFSFNVSSPTSPSILANGTPPDAVLNHPYNYQMNFCCAAGSLSYQITVGSLPTGLNIVGNAITGTPTVAGRVQFTIQATDSANSSNYGIRVWTINVSPIQVAVFTPYGNTLTSYTGGSLSASGGTSPYTYTVAPGTELPPGVLMNLNTGALSGSPTTAGQFNFSYIVTDNAGNSYTGYSSILIYPAGGGPPIAFNQGPILGTYSIGTQQIQLAASGGTGSYTWSVLDPQDFPLPPGLALRTDVPTFFAPNATAGLIGVAVTAGTYPFTLQVTSGSQTATQAATLKITALTLKDSSLPDAFVGTAYSYQVTALNNAGTVHFNSATGLPPGTPAMTLDPNTGILSGTPTTPGFYNINFTLTDGTDSINRNITINVYAVQITTPGGTGMPPGVLPNGTQNASYSSVTLTASGGTGAPYTFTGTGLPGGLSMNSSGTISSPGTLNAGPGKYNISVTATDSSGLHSYTKQMSLDVIGTPAIPLSIQPGILNDAVIGDSYTWGISVNGGVAPYTWTTVTGLPAGMSLRSGSGLTSSNIYPGDAEIWGVASTASAGTFNATVQDFTGATTSLTIPFNVRVLDVSQGSFLPNGTLNQPGYSANLRVLGGVSPYGVNQVAGQLPAGLTLNPSTMQITGTPAENGNFNIELIFHDSATPAVNVLERQLNININTATQPGININTFSNLGTYYVGNTLNNIQLNACCVANYIWSVVTTNLPVGVSPTLPPGITGISGSQFTGAFTTPGTYSFLLQAADQAGVAAAGQRLFTVTVNPSAPITLTTVPPGLPVSVDNGPAQTAPFIANLSPGLHNISVPGILTEGGTQFVFTSWSDFSAASHLISVVGSSPATYTANFQTQYLLTTAASPFAGGSLTPPGAGAFYPAGTVVTVTANPSIGYQFANFSGGTLTGSTISQNVTMNGPTNVVANFTPVQANLAVSIASRTPSGPNLVVSFTLTNSGLGTAMNATITSITGISDVSGSGAVTVASPTTPLNLGPISPGGSASGSITFNWPSTATRVTFTVNFVADGVAAKSSRITIFY